MVSSSSEKIKILIANRGEIALRIIRACRLMGYSSVLVYSEADRHSLPVQFADEAICIGPASAAESYLKIDRIIAAAELTGAKVIHPGYGFLAENAHFADVCTACNMIFVGPSSRAIRALGDKAMARSTMKTAGVAIIPGSRSSLESVEEAKEEAKKLGYPVLLKAVSGGGGKGMRVVECEDEIHDAFHNASQEAWHAFKDASLYMEKFIENPRHVEIQIMGDKYGRYVHLGDRDCSLQRHHQKLIEETPCASLTSKMRRKMCETAIKAAKAVDYVGAGTVEFLVQGHNFYFMEMNTRLQVEHSVTEMLTGTDIVREQLRVALGEHLSWRQSDIHFDGHAIEVRVNAENTDKNFMPCPGKIGLFLMPGGPGVRVDTHIYTGYVIPPYYDSLLGKIVAKGLNRELALKRCQTALREFVVEGVQTTKDFTAELLSLPEFIDGTYTTNTVDDYLKKKAEAVKNTKNK
ncbi:MAG: acetyl-CoA carboxylase biotin carboxylase subunit [Lentisphaeria bacterium]